MGILIVNEGRDSVSVATVQHEDFLEESGRFFLVDGQCVIASDRSDEYAAGILKNLAGRLPAIRQERKGGDMWLPLDFWWGTEQQQDEVEVALIVLGIPIDRVPNKVPVDVYCGTFAHKQAQIGHPGRCKSGVTVLSGPGQVQARADALPNIDGSPLTHECLPGIS